VLKTKQVLKFIFSLIGVVIFFWFFTNSEDVSKIREIITRYGLNDSKEENIQEETRSVISELSQPKGVKFSWEYNNVLYSFSQVFYKSTWDFYHSQPKVFKSYGEVPKNWEEDFYGIFLEEAEGDGTIAEIVAQLKNLGSQENLSADQTVELAVTFVQSIPYDYEKAERILRGEEESPRYPYEVLYEQKGVCSGKSFLLISLLRELNYGSVLLEYEGVKHMAVGIKCPQEYSNYDSGYCYIESTSEGHRIGMVPYLDPDNNFALAKQELEYFDENNNANLKNIGEVAFYQIKDGQTYRSVAETIKTVKETVALEGEIFKLRDSLKKDKENIKNLEEELENLGAKMEKYKEEKNYEKYNSLVPEYNDLLISLSDDLEKYNEKVESCNQKINSYNQLIRAF